MTVKFFVLPQFHSKLYGYPGGENAEVVLQVEDFRRGLDNPEPPEHVHHRHLDLQVSQPHPDTLPGTQAERHENAHRGGLLVVVQKALRFEGQRVWEVVRVCHDVGERDEDRALGGDSELPELHCVRRLAVDEVDRRVAAERLDDDGLGVFELLIVFVRRLGFVSNVLVDFVNDFLLDVLVLAEFVKQKLEDLVFFKCL